MNSDILLVLIILGGAILLFITNRVRVDLIGLMVMGALAVSGLISAEDALSGFSSPAVITVWAVLILSGGLARTGVASKLGKFVLQLAGESEIRLLAIIMLTSGILSGFMNSIGVASLFLPVVIDISRRTNQPPSKLLIPLAFASLMGGLNTLIGTPPNILISEALTEANLSPFQMFDFTPIGLTILFTGTIYMILIGRHLLPSKDITKDLVRREDEVTDLYDFQERMAFVHLPENSSLDGRSLQESRLGSALELNVITILRDQQTILAPGPDFILRSRDRLLVEGRLDHLLNLYNKDHHFLDEQPLPVEKIHSATVQLAEAVIPADSPLIGLTLAQAAFRHSYNAIVLAIRREGKVTYSDLETIVLKENDRLLLKAQQADLKILQAETDFMLSPPDPLADYQLDEHLLMARVPDGSSLVGSSLLDSRLGDAYGLSVQGIIRGDDVELMPAPDEILQAGDTLIIKGKPGELNTIQGLQSLLLEPDTQPDLSELETEETSLIEVVLSPRSGLAGKAVRELDFRSRYGLTILAIWREGRAYRSHLRDMKLRLGDALLLFGPRRRLRLLGTEPDFVVLTEKALPAPRTNKAPLAILVMALVLVPVIFNWLPIAVSAVAGVVLMILSGCLSMEEAYQQIEWKAVFLIAGMLPLGIALDQTGAAQLISANMLELVGRAGPGVITTALFLLASVGSQIMPNPAVAVLLAPIALSAAGNLGISPYPLMMAVAVSSSSAYLSPIGHPANLLVMGPGGYKFSDYTKVGLPLTILTWLIVLLVLPLIWPY